MRPPALRSDHVVIPIRDAEASLAFYRDTLGLPLVDAITGDDWGGFPWLMMMFRLADDREVVLVALRGAPEPPPDRLPRDARHYAFAIEGDLDAWKARLVERGVAHREEDHGSQRSLYVADPSGTTLEITTPPTPALASAPNPRAAAVVAAWRSS